LKITNHKFKGLKLKILGVVENRPIQIGILSGRCQEWRGETEDGRYVILRFYMGAIAAGVNERELRAGTEIELVGNASRFEIELDKLLKALEWEAKESFDFRLT
jgi:hypothetical protein